MDAHQQKLQDLILAHANLMDDARHAYEQAEFKKSIECLVKIIDADANNMDARLMLAMSYVADGQLYNAMLHYKHLVTHCTHPEILQEARDGILMVEDYQRQAPRQWKAWG